MAFTLTIPSTKEEYKVLAVGINHSLQNNAQVIKAKKQAVDVLNVTKEKSKGLIGRLGTRLVKFAE